MKTEDKQLLLADLCARLPYGVIIQEYNEEYGYADNALNTIGIGYFSIHEACIEGTWINRIVNIRPYLRPMTSMTEEEKIEYGDRCYFALDCISTNQQYYFNELYDWLNAHHFDYRGLIKKGLAIEATEEMYKVEKQQ